MRDANTSRCFKDVRSRRSSKPWIRKEVAVWQRKDGSFPVMGWMRDGNAENEGYATAFATLILGVPEARLSVYNRMPPKLPKG